MNVAFPSVFRPAEKATLALTAFHCLKPCPYSELALYVRKKGLKRISFFKRAQMSSLNVSWLKRLIAISLAPLSEHDSCTIIPSQKRVDCLTQAPMFLVAKRCLFWIIIRPSLIRPVYIWKVHHCSFDSIWIWFCVKSNFFRAETHSATGWCTL